MVIEIQNIVYPREPGNASQLGEILQVGVEGCIGVTLLPLGTGEFRQQQWSVLFSLDYDSHSILQALLNTYR